MAANLERLKKRIKALEEWTDENEALGGPEGTLDTFNYLIMRVKQADQMQNHFSHIGKEIRNLVMLYMKHGSKA